MLKKDSNMAGFMAEKAQQQFGFALGQLTNPQAIGNNDVGTLVATQVGLPDVLSYRISRTQNIESDTCTLTFADDNAQRFSKNSKGRLASLFYPGPIKKKMVLYLGYKGPLFTGKPNFNPYSAVAIPQFTGFVETDAAAQSVFMMDKTVTLNDLTSQFKAQVYDTFPHALFGDQTLSYFDPAYNLTAITNPGGGGIDGKVWQCDARMFTMDESDPVWGVTNMPIHIYVALPGDPPQGTRLSGTMSIPTFPNTVGTISGGGGDGANGTTFDYADGVVTFSSSYLTFRGHAGGLPVKSSVSLQGNPTYMAPEIMVRKLLVEKGSWPLALTDLQETNTLLPMFDGQDRSIWTCLQSIAAMTSPRFTPWKIWADESGVIHFYETNLDSPPKRYWFNGRGVFTANHEYTARDVKTVVRGDGTIAVAGDGTDSGSDQAITAIAYDNRAIFEYGLTEPLLLSQDATDSVRHLSPTQAVAHLNLIAQSTLYQVSRPVFTIQADVVPDYFLQIGDKVHYRDDNIGYDSEMEVVGIEKSGDGKSKAAMTVTLQEYYETINMNLGVPAGVTDQGSQGATQAPPTSAIIGAVRMGNDPAEYVFKDGDFTRDQQGNPIIATWAGEINGPDDMHFDYMLWAKGKAEGGSGNEWSYNNLPPVVGGTWAPEIDDSGRTVYYIPHATGAGGNGNTYYVGPDSVFYQYNNGANPPNNNPGSPPALGGGGGTHYHIQQADLPYTWIPPGNRSSGHNGKGYDCWVWAWWYLCADSNIIDPDTGDYYWDEPFKEKNGRLLMRLDPLYNGTTMNHQDAHKIHIADNTSQWIYNSWNPYPGPHDITGCTKNYKHLVVGCSDYTKTPPGFVGANVLGDGVQMGVAYGPDVGSGFRYVNYQKRTKGHFCLYALDSDGGSQFLRIPFYLKMT